MEKLSRNLVNLIQRNNPSLTDLQTLKIEFGLNCIFGELTKFILYLIIFSIFSQTKYFLIAMLFFCTIRCVAGGYHEETFWRCFFTSLLMFIITIIFGLYIDFPLWARSFILTLSILLVWVYAPVDHPNKPIISNRRRQNLKYISLFITLLCGGVTFLLPSKQAVVALTAIFFESLSLLIGNISKRSLSDESTER